MNAKHIWRDVRRLPRGSASVCCCEAADAGRVGLRAIYVSASAWPPFCCRDAPDRFCSVDVDGLVAPTHIFSPGVRAPLHPPVLPSRSLDQPPKNKPKSASVKGPGVALDPGINARAALLSGPLSKECGAHQRGAPERSEIDEAGVQQLLKISVNRRRCAVPAVCEVNADVLDCV